MQTIKKQNRIVSSDSQSKISVTLFKESTTITFYDVVFLIVGNPIIKILLLLILSVYLCRLYLLLTD